MIFGILLIAFFVRLIHLDQSLWLDEATNVVASSKSLSDILFHLKLDFHPPLYYYILHFWVSLFGQNEVTIRLPSVIFGVATVYLTYLIGKQIYSKNVGLWASLLVALSQFHIYYSQEARMYSLATFGSALSVWALLRLIKRPSIYFAILYGLTVAVAIYADYFSFFVILAQVIWVGLENRKKVQKWIRPYLFGLGLASVLYLPWVPRFVEQLRLGANAVADSPEWINAIGGVSAKSAPLLFAKFASGNFSFINKETYVLYILVPVIVTAGLITLSLKKKIGLVQLWFVVPFILSLVISLKIPIFSVFRLLVILPAFWLCGAYSAVNLKTSYKYLLLGVLIFWLVLAIGIYSFNPNFQREDWRSVGNYIDANSKNQRAITISVDKAQRSPYLYYNKTVQAGGPQSWQAGNYDKIWLMRYLQPLFDPQDNVRKSIEAAGYIKFDQQNFRGVEVWGYQK